MEDRAGFDEDLLAPWPGHARKVKEPTPADIEEDGAAFMDFMGAVNG